MKNHWLARRRQNDLHAWDFNTALGDVLKVEYEPFYVRVIEVKNVVNRRPLPTAFLTDEGWGE